MSQNAANMRASAVEIHNDYVMVFDYDASNNLIYIGKADIGTSKASAAWHISKLIYDASNNLTDMQTAGGDGAYTYIWNDRATLSYS